MAVKAKLVQGGDGTAIPAGFVGEYVTWTTPPSSLSVSTLADWTNATITLGVGRWLIIASIQAGYTTGATAGNKGNTHAYITDASNNVIDNCEGVVHIQTSANAAAEIFSYICLSTVVSIASQTTYKIRAKRTDTSGTGSGALFNESDARSKFYAVRLPG